MNKLITTISILLIATASYAQTYTVERVIDGEYLKLTNGKIVRFISIDATNRFPMDDSDLEVWQETTEFVKRLIKEGQEIRLELDVQERDYYGRLWAYVYTTITCGGGNGPIQMVLHGITASGYIHHKKSHNVGLT